MAALLHEVAFACVKGVEKRFPRFPEPLKWVQMAALLSSQTHPKVFPNQLIAWLRRDDKMRVFNTLLQNSTTKLYYLHSSNPWYLCGTYISWKVRRLNSKTGHKRRSQEREVKNMNQKTDCIDTRRVYTQKSLENSDEKSGIWAKKMVRPQGLEPWTQWLRVICSTDWAMGARCNSSDYPINISSFQKKSSHFFNFFHHFSKK